ncbi:MAG: helix-turn-helix domain-containing protein [Planctomycetes bacterium]|nr:helix-turn-helix domain-containing protein [Planctomycetota bacterium]
MTPTTTDTRTQTAAQPDRWLREQYAAEHFERGAIVIENTFMQTDAGGRTPLVAYVHEGLVRGVWHRDKIAPTSRATALVAGDGCWIGVDAFKHGENLFRYQALAPTVATILPMSSLKIEAPRAVVVHAMENLARDWCTAVSLLSLGNQTLTCRAMVLLHHMSRVHPRPEIEVRQQDLADMLGVARQSLQPVLKRLASGGLIDLGYGEIVVADSGRLFDELRRGRRPVPPTTAAARDAGATAPPARG